MNNKQSTFNQFLESRKAVKIKKPSNKSLVIFLCVVLAVPTFILARYYLIEYALPTPQRTVNRYFIHIANEEYEKAFQLLKDPFKSSKGSSVEEFASLFDRSRKHGTVYQKANILRVSDTNRVSIKMVSFELNLREKGKQTKSNGAYYLEKDSATKQWLIFDSAS
jgi:hypothetical protein